MSFTPEQWLQFGAVVVFAWFALQIIEKVFVFISGLTKKGNPEDPTDGRLMLDAICRVETSLKLVAEKVGDLHKWHNVQDPRTGTPVWYSSFQNSMLQETLTKVSESLQSISDILRELSIQQREGQKDTERSMKALMEQEKVTSETLGRVQEDLSEVKRVARLS